MTASIYRTGKSTGRSRTRGSYADSSIDSRKALHNTTTPPDELRALARRNTAGAESTTAEDVRRFFDMLDLWP